MSHIHWHFLLGAPLDVRRPQATVTVLILFGNSSSTMKERNSIASNKAREMDRFLLLSSISFGSVHERPEAGVYTKLREFRKNQEYPAGRHFAHAA